MAVDYRTIDIENAATPLTDRAAYTLAAKWARNALAGELLTDYAVETARKISGYDDPQAVTEGGPVVALARAAMLWAHSVPLDDMGDVFYAALEEVRAAAACEDIRGRVAKIAVEWK